MNHIQLYKYLSIQKKLNISHKQLDFNKVIVHWGNIKSPVLVYVRKNYEKESL